MKILTLTVRNTKQAKLIIKPYISIIKIPANLSPAKQKELRLKLMKVADMNAHKKEFFKMYYKIGTPYLFLNRKVSSQKRETAEVYKFAEL